MKRRGAMLVLISAGLVVLALLTVFAIELSNTQARSKRDVEARVHERVVLAAALIDSLFRTSQQQIPFYQVKYGGRVPAKTMEKNRVQNTYLVLLDSAGRVLASSEGFTPQARAELSRSAALALVRSGLPYGVGNLLPYGSTGVIDLAVAFPTRYGRRILLSSFTPLLLGAFLGGELAKIPGVSGEHNYVLDGNDTVLASTDPATPVGSRITKRALATALGGSAGDRNGDYYDQARLPSSSWRIVLVAPDGALFASVSGLRKWVPWLIFIAFALVAAAALALGWRVLRSAATDLGIANARLAAVNHELEDSNETLAHRAVELARSNAELEQFASIASHDLQEPLRKVRTFTEQLTVIEADRLSEKGRDYLQRANRAAERMQTQIQDLLQFSRVTTQARPFASVDLQQVARDTLEDLSIELERSAAIVHVGALPVISADALQMRQLLQNLISNALKFRRDGIAPELRIDGTVAEELVRLTVRDNGIGFEPQYNLRIFRIFERLHGRSKYPGTGIGLALCRKIAERHGGSIVADSELGVGSTFTVTLPLHHPDALVDSRSHERSPARVDREETHVRA